MRSRGIISGTSYVAPNKLSGGTIPTARLSAPTSFLAPSRVADDDFVCHPANYQFRDTLAWLEDIQCSLLSIGPVFTYSQILTIHSDSIHTSFTDLISWVRSIEITNNGPGIAYILNDSILVAILLPNQSRLLPLQGVLGLSGYSDTTATVKTQIRGFGACRAPVPPITTYWNVAQTATCPPGYSGSPSIVGDNTVSSTISQDDANTQAMLLATSELVCHLIYWNTAQTSPPCPAGYYGSPVTIPANTYSSIISQADADSQALSAATAARICTAYSLPYVYFDPAFFNSLSDGASLGSTWTSSSSQSAPQYTAPLTAPCFLRKNVLNGNSAAEFLSTGTFGQIFSSSTGAYPSVTQYSVVIVYRVIGAGELCVLNIGLTQIRELGVMFFHMPTGALDVTQSSVDDYFNAETYETVNTWHKLIVTRVGGVTKIILDGHLLTYTSRFGTTMGADWSEGTRGFAFPIPSRLSGTPTMQLAMFKSYSTGFTDAQIATIHAEINATFGI